MTEQEKVIRDGNVAVLVSPGFGAGWSTWTDGNKRQWALFAPEVVAWVEAGKPGGEKAAQELVAAKFGTGDEGYFYCGGACDLCVEWIPQGTRFRIDEYDGSESLESLGEIDFNVA